MGNSVLFCSKTIFALTYVYGKFCNDLYNNVTQIFIDSVPTWTP